MLTSEPIPRGTRSRFALVATVLLAAATILCAYSGAARIRSNRVLRVAEDQTRSMATRGQLDRGILRRNATALELAIPGARDDERIPLAIGSHYLLLGELARAESWYLRSLDLAPRAEAYLNLGRVMNLRGDSEAARQLFDKAVILSPALAAEIAPR